MRRANLLYLMGMLVIALCVVAGPAKGMAAYRDYVSTVSTGGLNQPAKVAVDQATGDVYVTDAGNKAVKKYDVNGNYDSGFSLSVSGTPVGIAVNSGNIFVGDDTNDCVWIYDKTGALADLNSTGTTHKLGGAAAAALKMPNTVTIAPAGHIFVVDGDSDKVYIFNANGLQNSTFCASGSTSSGTSIQAYYPIGLVMGSSTGTSSVTQTFYLGDQGNYRVQKLTYVYTAATSAITIPPTFVSSIGAGTRSDAFGSFLRVSDLAWDSVYSRLIVIDSLQMVGQVFDVNGATTSTAFNYSGTVQGYLNVPTGAAVYFDAGKGLRSNTLFVANNQADSLVSFSMNDGVPPTVTSVSPATDVTPSTTPYTIDYSVADSDSASVTTNFYYYEIGDPATKTLIGSQVATLSGGTYTGTYNWNWGALPVGTYKVYAVVVDANSNSGNGTSAGSLLVVTNYDGCTGYTNGDYALYGAAASDNDSDGLSNCIEATGNGHTDAANTYTSDPQVADTDADGLTDGEEDNAKVLFGITCYLNPNSADTDGGGISDKVEINKFKDPCNGADDDDPDVVPQTLGGAVNIGDPSYINDTYLELANTSTTDTVVGDVVLRRTDASIVTTIKAVTIPPKGSKAIHINDYTTERNIAADFVSYGTRHVVGTITTYLLNHYDHSQVDGDYSVSIDLVGAPFIQSGFLNAGTSRYTCYMTLRNPSFTSSVTARVTFYNSAGTLMAQTPKDYVIPPAGSVVINPNDPADLGLPNGQYSCTVQGLDGNVAGHYVQFRSNTADATLCAYAFGVLLESTTANMLVVDTMNDAQNGSGYRTWMSIKNPNAFPINIDTTYYDAAGVAKLTTTKAIPALQNKVWNPEVTDFVPNGITPGQYSAKVVGQAGAQISGYFIMFRRSVATLEEWFDQASEYQRDFTKTAMYVPYWNESLDAPTHLPVTWFVLRNPGASPINITIEYYDKDGNTNSTKTITALAPNALKAIRCTSAANQAGVTVTEGSARLTGTGPFTGWIWRFTRNPYDNALNDSGSGNPMCAIP